MSLLRGSSSSRLPGNNSGIYTGISGSLSIANNGGGDNRIPYGNPLAGFLSENPSFLLAKRTPLDYPASRKRQRIKDHIPCISGFSLPSGGRTEDGQAPAGVFEEEMVMRSRLQELERALLDDDQEDAGVESEIIDAGSNWKETMQNLISSASTSSPSPASVCSSTSPAVADPKQLLLDSLVALSEGRLENAVAGVSLVRQVCTPCSPQAEHRLLAHIARAIGTRQIPHEVLPPGFAELSSPEHLVSVQMLFGVSVCFKLGFVAANLAILDAVAGLNRIHIIDFDIGKGQQYTTLIQAVAQRKSGRPTSLRITAVVVDSISGHVTGLRLVGDQLEKMAELLGVKCSFHVVAAWRTGELNRERLGCGGESEEAVVVNFAYRLYRVADESVSTENPRDAMLRLAKGLNPAAVVLVEQVMNSNTTPLAARFGEVVSYYRALVESLDVKDGEERSKVEDVIGRRAANAVACEGSERVERCEVAGKWRARFEMAGFRPRLLPPHLLFTISSQLKTHRNPGFTLREESDGICFGWNDRLLTYASSWH